MKVSKQSGFSLLELLVTILIVGLAAGAVSLSIGRGVNPYETRWVAKKLRSTIELAAEEVQFSGDNFGLAFYRSDIDKPWQFDWYRQVDLNWLPVAEHAGDLSQQEIFGKGELPEGFDIDIRSPNGMSLFDTDKTGDAKKPQILFFGSGEITPFQLSLENENNDIRYRLDGDMLGRIRLYENDDRVL